MSIFGQCRPTRRWLDKRPGEPPPLFEVHHVSSLLIAAALAADARVQRLTTYETGHFYATPTTANGQRLKLAVDTGGDGCAV